MNRFIQTQCINAIENVLESPLGVGVMEFFESYNANYKSLFPIDTIRKNIRQNIYVDVKEFDNAVKNCFLNAAASLGRKTNIAIALRNLYQQFSEQVMPMYPFDVELFRNKVAKYTENLTNILDDIPNDFEEFQALLDKLDTLPFLEPDDLTPEKDNEKSDIDFKELKRQIQQLKSDNDDAKIVDIVTRYESQYGQSDDLLSFDLSACHPHTLRMIKNYIDSVNVEKTE